MITEPVLTGRHVWKAYQAWWCVGALVLLNWINQDFIWLVHYNLAAADWMRRYPYYLDDALSLLISCVWIALAFFFSETHSVRIFTVEAGLCRKPSLAGWLFAWGAIGIAFAGHYGTSRGWTGINAWEQQIGQRGGLPLFLFMVFVICIGPFFEEVLYRGFLYRAFRGSHGFLVSTFFIAVIAVGFHYDKASSSVYGLSCIAMNFAWLCLVRERTGSVWDCLLSHAAYNATLTLIWPIWFSALMLLLPIWWRPQEAVDWFLRRGSSNRRTREDC